ncbi:hypothetical protein SAMN05421493_10135 [Pseudobutyrivibrio sp. 49]|uniref:hypothetical protein n=1 Tax=Pseudobutyrivibrio sp. 49 TaxID=1855344 RepID=UPI000892510B|nr:hypothetical protein [Pseudobutyrivibrio sp. 49]SDH25737.1 hypothetical protein SAMN05421493_10135 [Pseudobutyrivibrio sp. 49]
MKVFYQGDIIKISGFGNLFLIISKNVFIRERKMFHVSPIVNTDIINPMNIDIKGVDGTEGTVICEEIKLIDPVARACTKVDRINYWGIINISDAIQGMFEYD